MLQSMGSQKVTLDWVTELNWTNIYHNLFIHSSVNGQLGCFQVLAIVNSATVSNGIHGSFLIFVSSGYMPRSGIAGSYGGFIPSFLGISILSSRVAVSIYIPTNSAGALHFLHTLSSIYSFKLFDEGHSDSYEVITHCNFDLQFSNNQWCWASFHVFVIYLFVFFGEMSI